MKTRRFLVVVLWLFVSAAPAWGDDQAASVDSIRERAAQGDAQAQFNLGAAILSLSC
jgi:predicted NBD/HSP70 family sugar kinase